MLIGLVSLAICICLTCKDDPETAGVDKTNEKDEMDEMMAMMEAAQAEAEMEMWSIMPINLRSKTIKRTISMSVNYIIQNEIDVR